MNRFEANQANPYRYVKLDNFYEKKFVYSR